MLKVAQIFYSSSCDSDTVLDIREKLKNQPTFIDNFTVWQGNFDRNGYGIFRKTVTVSSKKERISFFVHRLAYYIHHGGTKHLNPSMHVLHCCHNKLCINIDHLSYEESPINATLNRLCKSDVKF